MSGYDKNVLIASKVFKVSPSEVTSAMREAVKVTASSTLHGLRRWSPKSIRKVVGLYFY